MTLSRPRNGSTRSLRSGPEPLLVKRATAFTSNAILLDDVKRDSGREGSPEVAPGER